MTDFVLTREIERLQRRVDELEERLHQAQAEVPPPTSKAVTGSRLNAPVRLNRHGANLPLPPGSDVTFHVDVPMPENGVVARLADEITVAMLPTSVLEVVSSSSWLTTFQKASNRLLVRPSREPWESFR
jgi:hypothetical protein